MNWSTFDTWIVVTGALTAVACALPGCFLVLRKMSMMGDAISHAVLPGLAIAFLLTQTRASFPMFIGAALTGVLTAAFTQWIARFGNVDKGAAMGIVFTTLFAIGLLLIVRAADHVDLDPGCVLYGAIEFTPIDTVELGSLTIPRAALVAGGVLLLNLLIIIAFFKEFRLSAFDPGLADTLGFNSHFLHYLLMTMVAITTVAAFEAVGSIIVIAMLIVPPATALLLSNKLIPVLSIASVFAVASAFLGHYSAVAIPAAFGLSSTNTSGMIATSAGLLFIVVWMTKLGRDALRRGQNWDELHPDFEAETAKERSL
ncbi:MAG: metal ABC transporter permease [Verrucomicrobiota bacterium JB023]|nr:metal ABC transporter permease [Verrucomicrobiota bacterium JB023]